MDLVRELHRQDAVAVLEYIVNRKRTAKVTDLLQVASILKLKTKDVRQVFRCFESHGLGLIESRNSRTVFVWKLWPFFKLNSQGRPLACALYPIETFQNDRNAFKRYKSKHITDLSHIETSDLLIELQNRGLILNIGLTASG